MQGGQSALDCAGARAGWSGGARGRRLDEGAHHRRGGHDRAQIDDAPRPRRKTRGPRRSPMRISSTSWRRCADGRAFPGHDRRVRHRRALCRAKTRRGAPGHHLPARLGRLGRSGGRFRQGLCHQSRRNAGNIRGDPARAGPLRRGAIGRASSSRPRSRSSARPFPTRSTTNSSPRR